MIPILKTIVYLEVLTAVGLLIFNWSLSAAARKQLGYRPAAIALLLPPVLFLAPALFLVHLVCLLLVPLLAQRREQVAGLYVFAVMLVPELLFPAMAGSLFLIHYNLHMSIGLGALLALLMKFKGRAPPHGFSLDIPAVILLILLCIPYIRGESFTNFLRVAIEYVWMYGLPYFIVTRSIRSWEGIRQFALHLACAAAIIAVILIFEAGRAWQIYATTYGIHDVKLHIYSFQFRFGLMRAVGPALEPTSMAFAMLMCFFATLGARGYFRTPFTYGSIIALLLVALFMPQSRNAWLGLIIGLCAFGIYQRRYRVSVLTAGLALAIFTMTAVSPRFSEAVGLTGSASTTLDYRDRLNERGLEELRKSPIVGERQAVVYRNLKDLTQGQGIVDFVNTYLYMALMTGLIGATFFLFALVKPAVTVWRLRSRIGRSATDLRLAGFVFAVLVALIEMLAFTSFGGRVAILIFSFFGLSALMYGTLGTRETGSRRQRSRRPQFGHDEPAPGRPAESELPRPSGA